MFREVMMSSYMANMSGGVGLTCDMGKEGRSELDIGNGWTEHERPDGKKFYVHENGKRTWQRPVSALPLTDFQKCNAYVQTMKYEGRYPKGIETTANDGYDCESFLSKLYAVNEDKWSKEEFQAEAARRAVNGPAEPLPFFQKGHGNGLQHSYLNDTPSVPQSGLPPAATTSHTNISLDYSSHDRWIPTQQTESTH
ncbi:hypothetical protein DIPPA_64255 [Diplonema papillatum]|nr:hypothetical protein DIPPA_64255 [Diplonema papillatum]